MQKHQEWIDNRTYAQHLTHLQQIRVRKSRETTALSSSNPRKKKNRQLEIVNRQFQQDKQNQDVFQNVLETPDLQKENMFYTNSRNTSRQTDAQGQSKKGISQSKCFANFTRFTRPNTQVGSLKKRIKKQQPIDPSSITLKQKNLLWQNFLIGKRIIETPPVICKKRLDSDYNKHLQLLKSRSRPEFQSNFRQKKLKQYNENTVRIVDDIRVHSRSTKYVLMINIKDIIINKRKPYIKDLQLNLTYINKIKSTHARNPANIRLSQQQFSQQVHMSILDDYNFYFSVNKKHLRNQVFAFVQIRQLKGLSYLTVGAFCLPINENLIQSANLQTLQLSKVGKCIGHVDVQAKIVRKGQLRISNFQQVGKEKLSQQKVFRTHNNFINQKNKDNADGS